MCVANALHGIIARPLFSLGYSDFKQAEEGIGNEWKVGSNQKKH